MTDENVVANNHLTFSRGVKMFRDGQPSPHEAEWGDEEWLAAPKEQQLLWLGWMMGRAEPIIKEQRAHRERERVMILLGVPYDYKDPGYQDIDQ